MLRRHSTAVRIVSERHHGIGFLCCGVYFLCLDVTICLGVDWFFFLVVLGVYFNIGSEWRNLRERKNGAGGALANPLRRIWLALEAWAGWQRMTPVAGMTRLELKAWNLKMAGFYKSVIGFRRMTLRSAPLVQVGHRR